MSKAGEFSGWIDRIFEPPEYDYVPGWCEECDQEVTISTQIRPHGMARACEEHWPLSEFTETNNE